MKVKGLQIKLARIKRGLRQVDVAQRAGISQTALSKIERGVWPLSKKGLKHILRAIEEASRQNQNENENETED